MNRHASQQETATSTGDLSSPELKGHMWMAMAGCAMAIATWVGPLDAQDSAATAGVVGQSTSVETPKKKKGLLGKLKSIAQDKTVQQVAKVAACTMLPGGQYVAGAIDAGAGAAEGNAGGAAAGAAGMATGTTCIGGGAGASSAAAMGGATVPAGMASLAAGAAAQALTGLDDPADAEAGGANGVAFQLTPSQEKAFLKQMKKAGLSDSQAREQLATYRRMAGSAAGGDEP